MSVRTKNVRGIRHSSHLKTIAIKAVSPSLRPFVDSARVSLDLFSLETECATQNDTLNGLLQQQHQRRDHFNDDDDNMSTTPNERVVVETAAKSLDDDDVVLEMIRACVHKNQCYSCVGEDASVVDEKIVNDECAYTFASPLLSGSAKEQYPGGIFVNMKTRRAVKCYAWIRKDEQARFVFRETVSGFR